MGRGGGERSHGVKPSPFAYYAPTSVEEALGLLSSLGDDAKLLAGGQSLGPMLNLRLASPSALVDLNRIDGLDYLRVNDEGTLALGPLTRHRTVEHAESIRTGWPLLHEAMPFVGHLAIRNRGTAGGSIAHADPAAELPAAVIALKGELVLEGPNGRRSVGAESFFSTFLTTCLAADEMLREIRVPASASRSGQCWMEFSPRAGDYAIVGVAVSVRLDTAGRYEAARVVYAGTADVPVLADATRQMVGEAPSDALHEAVGQEAAASARPSSDLMASEAHRRHLVRVLTRRALGVAAARANGTQT
jgi:aerobic carbon-monoxide dehydrogenase medium subunit